MPLKYNLYQTVEILHNNSWVYLPAKSVEIIESEASKIVEFNITLRLPRFIDTVWNILNSTGIYKKKVRITQISAGYTHVYVGYIVNKPFRSVAPLQDEITLKCYDEAYLATQITFNDAYPKAGAATWDEIIKNVWRRHGPGGITFNGVKSKNTKMIRMVSPNDTIYNFMENIANHNGWTWKIVDSDLKFYNPTDVVSNEIIDQSSVIGQPEIDDDLPEIVNVVKIYSKHRERYFEDVQNVVQGQTFYTMQYQPLNREAEINGQTVQFDHPPTVYYKTSASGDWIELTTISDTDLQESTENGETTSNAQAIYNVENRWIKLNITPTTTVINGLKVIYTAEIKTMTIVRDYESIANFGERHHVINNTDRPTREDAIEMANSILLERAFPIQPITLEVTNFNLHVGEYVKVNLPDFGINQMMPIAKITRVCDGTQMHTQVVLNKAPISDFDLMVDLFKRISELEKVDQHSSSSGVLETFRTWDGDGLISEDSYVFKRSKAFYPDEIFIKDSGINILYPC